MSIKDFFSKIFNKKTKPNEPSLVKTNSVPVAKTEIIEEPPKPIEKDSFQLMCENEDSSKLNTYLQNKKLYTLNCKHVNRWLNCPLSVTPTYKKKPFEESRKMNNMMYFHYFINNIIYERYVIKNTYFQEEPIMMEEEINETLNFITDRINNFQKQYGNNYHIQVDEFNVSINRYTRVRDYKTSDLPITYYNSADIIIYNDKHCELINYSHTSFDKSINTYEFYLYSLTFLSHRNIDDDYTLKFVYYTPTLEKEYHSRTYINEESYKTKDVTYKEIKEWYKNNKYYIVRAALGTHYNKKGNWCKFCDHKCTDTISDILL